MKDTKIRLSDFIQNDRFELNVYLTRLLQFHSADFHMPGSGQGSVQAARHAAELPELIDEIAAGLVDISEEKGIVRA